MRVDFHVAFWPPTSFECTADLVINVHHGLASAWISRAHVDHPPEGGPAMQAITVQDRDAGVGGLSLTDVPYPHAAQNDVIVRVHAAGFTPDELDWSGTWVDRAGRNRTPSVPGHELSGVVVELGYRTTRPQRRSAGIRSERLDSQWLSGRILCGEARNLAPFRLTSTTLWPLPCRSPG